MDNCSSEEMTKHHIPDLDGARDLTDIFEIVKSVVRKTTGKERGGLMLALANLGGGMDGFVGAYHPVSTNIIVMNSLPLVRLEETDPALYKPYVFHILLHEYMHTLGILDEAAARRVVYDISVAAFGANHPVTRFAMGLSAFITKLVYPISGWAPPEDPPLELVRGFDRSSTDLYIR
jgi:hypothetical protein